MQNKIKLVPLWEAQREEFDKSKKQVETTIFERYREWSRKNDAVLLAQLMCAQENHQIYVHDFEYRGEKAAEKIEVHFVDHLNLLKPDNNDF